MDEACMSITRRWLGGRVNLHSSEDISIFYFIHGSASFHVVLGEETKVYVQLARDAVYRAENTSTI